MKKIIILTLLFTYLLHAKNYTIGYVNPDISNPWYHSQLIEIQNSLMKNPQLQLITKDAQGKIALQITNLEELINNKVDFIITAALHPEIIAKALHKAMKNNIKVILVSRHITTDDYTAFIAANNYQIGYDAAKYLAKKINYQGKVLMFQGKENVTTANEREQGFMDYMKQYNNISITKVRADYKKSEAIKYTEKIFVQEKQSFDAIYSHNDAMLMGFREVMKKYELPINIPTVGIDYIKEAQQAILEGTQSASFVYHTAGKEAIEVIQKIINNQPFDKEITLPTQIITKNNARKIEPIF